MKNVYTDKESEQIMDYLLIKAKEGVKDNTILFQNGVIDRFEEETKARKKDIEELKFFTEISKEAIWQGFDSNIDLIREEIKEEIKKLKTYFDVEHEVAITKSITTCRREFDEKLNVIKNQLYICMLIFGSLTLFLLLVLSIV